MEDTNKLENGENSNTWAWVVTGIVVFVAIIGLYSWPKSETPPVAEETQDEVDIPAQMLQKVSDSDDINSIEADLQASDYSNLDKEVSTIETEINAQ